MADLTPADLDELERLEREATAPPWESWRSCPHIPDHDCGSREIFATEPDLNCVRASICESTPGAGAEADMGLIAALRNHARSLIAAARERDALRSELYKAQDGIAWAESIFQGQHDDGLVGDLSLYPREVAAWKKKHSLRRAWWEAIDTNKGEAGSTDGRAQGDSPPEAVRVTEAANPPGMRAIGIEPGPASPPSLSRLQAFLVAVQGIEGVLDMGELEALVVLKRAVQARMAPEQ